MCCLLKEEGPDCTSRKTSSSYLQPIDALGMITRTPPPSPRPITLLDIPTPSQSATNVNEITVQSQGPIETTPKPILKHSKVSFRESLKLRYGNPICFSSECFVRHHATF